MASCVQFITTRFGIHKSPEGSVRTYKQPVKHLPQRGAPCKRGGGRATDGPICRTTNGPQGRFAMESLGTDEKRVASRRALTADFLLTEADRPTPWYWLMLSRR